MPANVIWSSKKWCYFIQQESWNSLSRLFTCIEKGGQWIVQCNQILGAELSMSWARWGSFSWAWIRTVPASCQYWILLVRIWNTIIVFQSRLCFIFSPQKIMWNQVFKTFLKDHIRVWVWILDHTKLMLTQTRQNHYPNSKLPSERDKLGELPNLTCQIVFPLKAYIVFSENLEFSMWWMQMDTSSILEMVDFISLLEIWLFFFLIPMAYQFAEIFIHSYEMPCSDATV